MHDERLNAFFEAVKAGHLGTLGELLDADPELAGARDRAGLSPLTIATYYGQRDVADLLIARGALVDLFVASALGDIARVTALLDENPPSIDARSADGWTPLALAAHFGQAGVASELLHRGADPNARSSNALSNTPLHAAVAGNRPELIDVLLRHGAEPDARDANGYTPLNIAAHAGSLEMVDLLLAGGADPTVPNDRGETPLAVANAQGHAEVADRLRRHRSG